MYVFYALNNIPDFRLDVNKIRGKVFLMQFDWFDFKQWSWYDWSIACTDKQTERNVVRKKAAVCGEKRCVTSLKTAAKETKGKMGNAETLFLSDAICVITQTEIATISSILFG